MMFVNVFSSESRVIYSVFEVLLRRKHLEAYVRRGGGRNLC